MSGAVVQNVVLRFCVVCSLLRELNIIALQVHYFDALLLWIHVCWKGVAGRRQVPADEGGRALVSSGYGGRLRGDEDVWIVFVTRNEYVSLAGNRSIYKKRVIGSHNEARYAPHAGGATCQD